jgi:hypothetical protein
MEVESFDPDDLIGNNINEASYSSYNNQFAFKPANDNIPSNEEEKY